MMIHVTYYIVLEQETYGVLPSPVERRMCVTLLQYIALYNMRAGTCYARCQARCWHPQAGHTSDTIFHNYITLQRNAMQNHAASACLLEHEAHVVRPDVGLPQARGPEHVGVLWELDPARPVRVRRLELHNMMCTCACACARACLCVCARARVCV